MFERDKIARAPHLATDMQERDDNQRDRADATLSIKLKPASPAVPTAAAEQNHNDDDD